MSPITWYDTGPHFEIIIHIYVSSNSSKKYASYQLHTTVKQLWEVKWGLTSHHSNMNARVRACDAAGAGDPLQLDHGGSQSSLDSWNNHKYVTSVSVTNVFSCSSGGSIVIVCTVNKKWYGWRLEECTPSDERSIMATMVLIRFPQSDRLTTVIALDRLVEWGPKPYPQSAQLVTSLGRRSLCSCISCLV